MRRRAAGLVPLAGAAAGLIVWALHFGALYLGNAIACARGLAARSLFGQPLVPTLILAATALALLLLLAIGLGAWRRAAAGRDDERFLAHFTLAAALLAAPAVAWAGAAALLVGPCGD